MKTLEKIFKERRVSYASVARELGITRSSVQALGNSLPKVETLAKIAPFLGMSVKELVGELLGENDPLVGFVENGGKVYRARTTADLRRIADEIDALGEGGKEERP